MSSTTEKLQEVCGQRGTRYYGGPAPDRTTIHATGEVNVEIHNGEVVAVWFRCSALPFTVSDHGVDRAEEMKRMYAEGQLPKVVGLELLDPNPKEK